MTELEKLEAGLPYDFRDPEVDARKLHAVKMCKVLNETDPTDYPACEKAIRELFGSVGKNPVVLPRFNCDNGKNIHVGDDFLTNYNVTILDIAPVTIGDHVIIGPGTQIITVNHPLSPSGRRKSLGIACLNLYILCFTSPTMKILFSLDTEVNIYSCTKLLS